MMAVLGNRMPQRLLLPAVCVAIAAAFLVDPGLAWAEEVADNGVVVTVEIAPAAPAPSPEEELPSTGAMALAPAAVATLALLGGAILLNGQRRGRSARR